MCLDARRDWPSRSSTMFSMLRWTRRIWARLPARIKPPKKPHGPPSSVSSRASATQQPLSTRRLPRSPPTAAVLTGSNPSPVTWSSERTSLLSENDILTALHDCFDPEVKLNLVDLGLIYSVETGPDPDSKPAWPRQWVKVTMTLTTPQCPASGLIFEQVHNRLAGISGISKVDVNLVWEPKWTPHRITEAGRLQLGL